MKDTEKKTLNERLRLINESIEAVQDEREQLRLQLLPLHAEKNKIEEVLERAEKPNLRGAFQALRKAGYFARMNFWCCQNCGWNAIPEERLDKVVFYHNQDNESLKEDGTCYVCWDGDPKEIINIFQENNIRTEWNGNRNSRILIDIN